MQRSVGEFGNPYSSAAGYTWDGGKDDVRVESNFRYFLTHQPVHGRQLIFARQFHGNKGTESTYFELLQEYSHLSNVHWRDEFQSYCRFDIYGDFEHVVTTSSHRHDGGMNLVTFLREPLEEYLEASDSILVQMFEFHLVKDADKFVSSRHLVEQSVTTHDLDNMHYKQNVFRELGAFTRGIQVVWPSRNRAQIFAAIKRGRFDFSETGSCEFIAWDWRNQKITTVSTDPLATTSYFVSSENSLPYETTPAFFRPEVLQKYKSDRQKYSIDEDLRFISCRGGWSLKSFDFNDAGQVHVYICDLAELPPKEQQYWLSFNERPRSGISERANAIDFEGKRFGSVDPSSKLRSILRDWINADAPWWKSKGERIELLVAPYTNNRGEWADSFSVLSKLAIEGFQRSAIRELLGKRNVAFCQNEKSLALIEKLLKDSELIEAGEQLRGLRMAWRIRSVVASHSAGSAAQELAKNAIERHGTYANHFRIVCATICGELELIERAWP